MRNKIEKTHVKEKNIIITRTRQYLRGSAICLRLRSCRDFTIIKEKYKVRPKPPLHELSLKKSSIKNHEQSFRVESSSRSNTTTFHKAQQISYLETSSITNINRNPQKKKKKKTIPHPCNSSSCPQARRPTETAHSFNFLIVTPLVNMFTGFLYP